MPTIVDKAAMNGDGSKPIQAHSTFPLNQRIAGGFRFGLYQPCSVDDTVPDDTLPLKSSHELRTLGLKAPLLGDVKLHKEFFDVPFSCMLPLNYEKLFVQPNIGEDVDASEVGLNIDGFATKHLLSFLNYFNALSAWTSGDTGQFAYNHDLGTALGFALRGMNALSYVLSSGSLLSSLGEDLSALFASDAVYTDLAGNDISGGFDRIYDAFISDIITVINSTSTKVCGVQFDSGAGSYEYVVDPSSDGSGNVLSIRQMLERADDASSVVFGFSGLPDIESYDFTTIFVSLYNALDDGILFSRADKPLSLARPLAYQLACAEFFTNSHVDYIYSAELYRQNLDSLIYGSDGLSSTRDTFSWNGVDYLYDTLSAHSLNKIYEVFDDVVDIDFETVADIINISLDGLRWIFGYNRSLRYVDYFTGSRTRPLAVGDVNVQVNNGYVNVVDTIQKRWTAKFLNQVNRVGRKLSEYTRALFPNATVHRDMHDPMWLAHVVDSVNAIETQNTGVAQQNNANSITSNLVSNGQRYAFEYRPERYGICIGILYFDIARYYPHVIERNNFNVDRNDYFNPFLQFNGDQLVYRDELYSGDAHNTFGYQGRDMQYKQKVDRCFGPFCVPNELPGWLFVADDSESVRGEDMISPDYIRSRTSEFDKFFIQLSGYSPATYYHFIVINTNNVNARRAMVANPQLD